MKKFFVVALLGLVSLSRPAEAQVGKDKLVHASVSYAMGMAFTQLLKHQAGLTNTQSIALGCASALMVGMAKEFTDGAADSDDLLANGVGVGASAVFQFAIDL